MMLSSLFLTFQSMSHSSASDVSDTIIIDVKKGTLTYNEDTYAIVGPRSNVLHIYNGRTSFSINHMNLKPTWRDNRGNLIPYGHVRNPLGIGRLNFLGPEEASRPCSIHGGAREQDLKKQLSGCCIRMLDKDFLELFWSIRTDTKIVINY